MIKSRIVGTNNIDLYKALIQVNQGNKSIIMSIDDKAFPQEVQVLYNNEWLDD